MLFMGIWDYNRQKNGGLLGYLLNSHPLALKHLMPTLMHFYIGEATSLYSPKSLLICLYAQRLNRPVPAPNFTTNSVSCLS